ncbi:MAG: beta-propeller fold lactonase family protein, partial [Acidobacteriota bacterium]
MSHQDPSPPGDSSRNPSRRRFIVGASAMALASSQISSALKLQGRRNGGKVFAYVGTDTSAIDGKGNGKGIYLFEMDPGGGKLSFVKLAAEAKSPSWLCLD